VVLPYAGGGVSFAIVKKPIMKTTTLLLAAMLLIFNVKSQATIITVSNNPVSGGQYTDVQSAINAATAGDTIYVMGSPIKYNNNSGINITKRLVLIGAGYNVTNTTNNNLNTVVGTFLLDSIAFNSQVSGTQIIGFYLTGSIYINSGYSIKNIIVSRCYVSGGISTSCSNGWVVENCIVGNTINLYGNTDVLSSMIIRNNFLLGG
jgi:hypothetical protein